MQTATVSLIPVKPILLEEKIQGMKTTMEFRTGKRISPVRNGMLRIPTLEVSTTVTSETLVTEPIHVILS